MRPAEKLVIVVAVAVPLLVATLGWPMFVRWLAAPAAPETPAVAGAMATPAATQPPAAATPRPTVRPPATVQPQARAGAQSQPQATVVAAPAPAAAASPSETVSSFYDLVAAHQFDAAAELWSPRMRAAFPPRANIDQRFGATQSISLQRAEVVSQDQGQASVAVDVLEAIANGGPRHYVGQWHLVRADGTWLLDQPELQTAP